MGDTFDAPLSEQELTLTAPSINTPRRMQGKVYRVKQGEGKGNGYGFCKGKDGRNYFLLYKEMRREHLPHAIKWVDLKEGLWVEFDWVDNEDPTKAPRAIDIRLAL